MVDLNVCKTRFISYENENAILLIR